AVMAANRIEYPVIYFAVIKLGAIVVPINARFTAAEIGSVVGHAEAETFFVAREFVPLIGQLRRDGQLHAGRRFTAIDEEDALRDAPTLASRAGSEPTDDVAVAIDEQDPHVMLYTSGTTGSPKGTLVSQRSYFLQATTAHLQLGFSEDDIGLSMFPMFHMGGSG